MPSDTGPDSRKKKTPSVSNGRREGKQGQDRRFMKESVDAYIPESQLVDSASGLPERKKQRSKSS